MKVAIILAAGGPAGQDAILAPYRSSGFVAGLAGHDVEPLIIDIAAGPEAGTVPVSTTGGNSPDGPDPVRSIRCSFAALAATLAAERLDIIQTFGPESMTAPIWTVAARTGAAIVHGVSAWRQESPDRAAADAPSCMTAPLASLALWRTRRASRHVDVVIGSSRTVVGSLIAAGFFPHATASVITPPPLEQTAPRPAPRPRGPAPVFGIYDPDASAATLAFVSHGITLTGRADPVPMRVALRRERRAGATVPALTLVDAAGIDPFVASIDILVIPTCDDATLAPLIAALAAGKSVIVPDRGGAAELIGYGRHGIMFAAGSAYHFANALNLVSQSWSQAPVLRQEGGPALARTAPAAVAATFARVYQDLAATGRDPAAAFRRTVAT